MSLARRSYNARSNRLPTVDELPSDPMDWDEEAQMQAVEQARTLANRDPDASQLLAAHVMAQPVQAAPSVYDPAQTEAALLLVAGLKPWEGDAMHFVRYFALVREISLAKERERDAMNSPNGATTYEQAYSDNE